MKVGLVGMLCFSYEVCIVKLNEDVLVELDDVLFFYEVGEIILCGLIMMVGYYNCEEVNKKLMYKGWYYFGDLGYFDKDGYLFVVDCVDDMVISGGVNIYFCEIEDFFYSYLGILDVVVFGELDELWGECVVVVIVKKDEIIIEVDLEMYCKESDELVDYKCLCYYLFVDEFFCNVSGKLQKFVLRELLKGVKKQKMQDVLYLWGILYFFVLNRRNNIFVNFNFFLVKVNQCI